MKQDDNNVSIFTRIAIQARRHNAINLGQGYPDFDCDKELKNHISQALKDGRNQYAPMMGVAELRKAIAEKIEHCYSVSIDPDCNICITAGATQALFTAIISLVSAGDEVIVIEPAYDSYIPSITIAGGKAIPIPLLAESMRVDWDRIEASINSKTRMIIINTPHNPTGTILSDADMCRLEMLASSRNIIVLSDEVYEHLVYDGEQHSSVLRYPELRKNALAVYSFGKTLHATGWKLGYIVGPDHLIRQFTSVHQWNVFSVNSFVQYGVSEYLKEPAVYLELAPFFQEKRNLMVQRMQGNGFKMLDCKGTYFVLWDYSDISGLDDMAFAQSLIEDIGVATIPLSPFYSDGSDEKLLRLCFAKTEETISKAMDKLGGLKI